MGPYTFLLYIFILMQLCIVLSHFAVYYLPRCILSINRKQHIIKDLTTERMLRYGTLLLFIALWLSASMVRGFDTIVSLVAAFIIAALIIKNLVSYVMDRVRDRNITHKYNIFYGKEDIEKEIKEFCDKYPEVQITISVAGSPIRALIKTNDQERLEYLVHAIESEESIMIDFNDKTINSIYQRNIALLAVSLLILGGFYVAYILGTILEYVA